MSSSCSQRLTRPDTEPQGQALLSAMLVKVEGKELQTHRSGAGSREIGWKRTGPLGHFNSLNCV